MPRSLQCTDTLLDELFLFPPRYVALLYYAISHVDPELFRELGIISAFSTLALLELDDIGYSRNEGRLCVCYFEGTHKSRCATAIYGDVCNPCRGIEFKTPLELSRDYPLLI